MEYLRQRAAIARENNKMGKVIDGGYAWKLVLGIEKQKKKQKQKKKRMAHSEMSAEVKDILF